MPVDTETSATPSIAGARRPAAVAGFRSLLFPTDDPPDLTVDPPALFRDLNIDQLIRGIAGGSDDRLRAYFYRPLLRRSDIEYRQSIFRDLESAPIHDLCTRFAERMSATRDCLAAAGRGHDRYAQQRWFLNAVDNYRSAVTSMLDDLTDGAPESVGLQRWRDFLQALASSAEFTRLSEEATGLIHDLSKVRYEVMIRQARLTVAGYDNEPDYGEVIRSTFERFAETSDEDLHPELRPDAWLNHIENELLERVALLNPELFGRLTAFSLAHQGFIDDVVDRVGHELRFYLSYRDYIEPIRSAGLEFCYPAVGERTDGFYARETYDLPLAAKVTLGSRSLVTNDLSLDDGERILVVSGPNQGGKTTTARTFGQLHYLTRLGCPVPGRGARIHVADRILTLFEREEDLGSLAGKLEDELRRAYDLLDRVTPDSVVILNEMFSSTTLQDADRLSRQVLRDVLDSGAIGVCVTFIDELSRLDPAAVSMVAQVDTDPAHRTFKVIRRRADGKAFALAIAEKYGLTYDQLGARIAS